MVRVRPALPAELPGFTSLERAEDAAPFVNTYVPFEAPAGADPDIEFLEKRIVLGAP